MNSLNTLWLILAMSGVTIALRALPFLVFGGKRETPKFIQCLGESLPFAVMAMLLVYCVKNVSLTKLPYGLPEALSLVLTAFLQFKKGNTLLSIALGTVFYMFLIQKVF